MTIIGKSKCFTLLNADDMADLAIFIQSKVYWKESFRFDGDDTEYQYSDLWQYIKYVHSNLRLSLVVIYDEDAIIEFHNSNGKIDMKEVF